MLKKQSAGVPDVRSMISIWRSRGVTHDHCDMKRTWSRRANHAGSYRRLSYKARFLVIAIPNEGQQGQVEE